MVELYVFLAIVVVFYTGLALKSRLKFKFCTICLAVSTVWVSLLVLRALGYFDNDVLLALLMGESVVGGYYLLDSKVKEQLLVFRLPTLLTMSYVAYGVVAKTVNWYVLGLLAILWAVHTGLYHYRSNPKVKGKVDQLIACCSRW